MEQIRTFLAIDLPPDVRAAIKDAVEGFRPKLDDVRWVKPDNVHLTLKFFGEVEADRVPPLRAALAEVARRVPPFDIAVRGAGAFPNLRRARVLWCGVHEPSGTLARLASEVDAAAADMGFEPEERAFKPHLTIARVKGRGRGRSKAVIKGAEAALGSCEAMELGEARVEEMVLFRSDLGPEGPAYTPLDRWRLAGPAEPH